MSSDVTANGGEHKVGLSAKWKKGDRSARGGNC